MLSITYGATEELDPAFVRAVVLQFFKPVRDPFYCVRTQTVAKVVAAAAGVEWSPKVARVVRSVVEDLGAVRVLRAHVSLFKGLLPREMSDDEAATLSADIRQTRFKGRALEGK